MMASPPYIIDLDTMVCTCASWMVIVSLGSVYEMLTVLLHALYKTLTVSPRALY